MSLVPALTGTASALPLPNTAPTPAGGEYVLAEQVQVAVQALLNQDASLELDKLSAPGGVVTGDVEITGDLEVGDDLVVGDLLTVEGFARFTGTQPASTSDPTPNAIYSTNQSKVWGQIVTDGVGGVAVVDGYNISGVALFSTTSVDVTFARSFANVGYAPQLTNLTASTARIPAADMANSTISRVRIQMRDVSGALYDPSTSVIEWSLDVKGRQ